MVWTDYINPVHVVVKKVQWCEKMGTRITWKEGINADPLAQMGEKINRSCAQMNTDEMRGMDEGSISGWVWR
ncbi:MAG: hypothetical protein WAS33_10000 [Candidatus Promineifilaceae bacterium]